MKQIVYDLKTKETKIIELPDMTEEEIDEIEKQLEAVEIENTTLPPTDAERLAALEMAILELAEVICNG